MLRFFYCLARAKMPLGFKTDGTGRCAIDGSLLSWLAGVSLRLSVFLKKQLLKFFLFFLGCVPFEKDLANFVT